MNNKNRVYKIILMFVGIVGLRIIPHIANCIPLFAFIAILSIEYNCNKIKLISFICAAMLVSDLLLHAIYNYPVLGSYSLFVYTGLLLIMLMQFKSISKNISLLINVASSHFNFLVMD